MMMGVMKLIVFKYLNFPSILLIFICHGVSLEASSIGYSITFRLVSSFRRATLLLVPSFSLYLSSLLCYSLSLCSPHGALLQVSNNH